MLTYKFYYIYLLIIITYIHTGRVVLCILFIIFIMNMYHIWLLFMCTKVLLTVLFTGELKSRAQKLFAVTVAKYPPPKARHRSFKDSSGWINSFMRRKKLENVRLTGKLTTADEAETEKYHDILSRLTEDGGYTAETVFNMNETGLQWKKMPKSTHVFKLSSQARERKADKSNITVLLCCNASGTGKLNPFIVHEANRPHTFRHFKSMDNSGMYWRKGSNSWLTGQLTQDWFDNYFVPGAWHHCRNLGVPFKVLLLLSNAPAHPPSLVDRCQSVKVEFLPPNTTSLLQPLDQELITNMKLLYQRRVYNHILAATDKLLLLQSSLVSRRFLRHGFL